ncbi:MAG: hypothetical protein ABII96_07525 [Candidatus Zixiibacteriota bacterium]
MTKLFFFQLIVTLLFHNSGLIPVAQEHCVSNPTLLVLNESNPKGEPANMEKGKIVFATFAHDPDELTWALVMIESIRTFGGTLRNVPVWLYLPENHPEMDIMAQDKQSSLRISVKKSRTPEEAKPLWFSGKVFASALAEKEASGKYEILAWLDPDMVFVKEPHAFLLDDGISLGYRPVMHQLIGSLYSEPPNEFWARLYQKLSVPDSSLFPMVTPVDQANLRSYFNAGMLIVRPKRGILRKWPECFKVLYTDSVFVEMCKKDQLKAIFLHQAALAGAILNMLHRSDMIELPPTYNYPLNLTDKYPADKKPKSLDELVMFRHDLMFSDPERKDQVKDTSMIFSWLKERFPKK